MTEATAEEAGDRVALLVQLRRMADAEALARQSLGRFPESPRLHLLLGLSLYDQERWPEAAGAFLEAARLAPEDPEVVTWVGMARWKIGKPLEAIACLEHSLRLDPHQCDVHAYLVDVYLDIANKTVAPDQRRRLGQAAFHGSEALRVDPTSRFGHLALAKVAVARRDAPLARFHATNALRLDPNDFLAHQLLGLAAQQERDHRLAVHHLRDSGRINPRSKITAHRLERSLRRAQPAPQRVREALVRQWNRVLPPRRSQ